MDKQHILSFIETQIKEGKISKEDLFLLADSQAGSVDTKTIAKDEPSRNLINILYAIGAIIAVAGVTILTNQHWDQIGFFGRIMVTLGLCVATYVAGLSFRKPEQKVISEVMFVIAASLAPLGVSVLLQQASISFDLSAQLLTAIILCVVFGTALVISKRNILLLLVVGFATWAYWCLVLKIFGTDYSDGDFLKWAGMLLGASYLFIAYRYRSIWTSIGLPEGGERKSIQNVLYGFGTFAILGAGILIGGSFDIIFIALIFAAFYGSVYLKSKAMLWLAALFLVADIIRLTSHYFVDSIGWPIALIIVGFLIIGVGYLTVYLNRKFISINAII